MRLFLTILEGLTPQEAVPVLASEDQELIRAVARALSVRLEGAAGATDAVLVRFGIGNRGKPDA